MKSILLFALCFASLSFGQRQVEEQLFSINILAPGVTYEVATADQSTFNANAHLGFFYRESDFYGDGFGLYPGVELQYRWYNNFKRRIAKSKPTFGNMGNFLAPTFSLQSGKAIVGNIDFNTDYFGTAGLVYGLQRTGKKGFQFNFMVGPGILFDDYETVPAILLDVRLGIVLGTKKWLKQ